MNDKTIGIEGMNITFNEERMRDLQIGYFNAKFMEDEIIEQVKRIKNSILKENEFFMDEKWNDETKDRSGFESKRIKDCKEDYLMNDDDFRRYLELVYEQEVIDGIAHDEGVGHVAEAPYTDLRLIAQEQLLEYFLQIIPAEYSSIIKTSINNVTHRQKALDLALKMPTGWEEKLKKRIEK